MAEYTIMLHGSIIGDIVTLDATESEMHTQDAEVTEFPTETGGAITDHVRAKQLTLLLRGTLSASPLDESLQSELRLEDAHEALLAAVEEGAPTTIVTGLTFYQNMVIRSYSAERSGQGGRSLAVVLDLVQVRIVDEVEVDIPPSILDPFTTRPDGQSKKDAGAQTGQKPDENETKAAASGLKQITGGGSILGGLGQGVSGLFP